MITWGWTGMAHDASLAVFNDNGLEFAAHSERYSRIKNDRNLHPDLITEALEYGKPDRIYFYEKPWLKKTRQLYAGQYTLLGKESPTTYMRKYLKDAPRCTTTSHHLSHAAAGYYTNPFDRAHAAVLVLDSIGEWDTVSIWEGKGTKLRKRWSQRYPHSVGIWYSAMTQRIGLKPQEHEYILMGMAAIGDADKYYDLVKQDFIEKMPSAKDPRVLFKRNCHRGCTDWRTDLNTIQDYADIAAATQRIYEEIFEQFVKATAELVDSKNLVLMGGCALNCVANSIAYKYFKEVWIMPNPGDAGSAIGCVLAHKREFMEFPNAYTGHNIEGDYPVEQLLQELLTTGIVGVAAGRAEFGPRALGNRSLLADPRRPEIKDRVNDIKHRELFRPFAPAILAEYAKDYFKGRTGPFMQYTSTCTNSGLPAIVHRDGSSRVQTVPIDQSMGFRKLLERWYEETGCPVLLNTSLNIKGEPLVNTREDATRWKEKYGVKICLPESGDG